jgi:sigma-B regulation protein RsbU (phosphoserine phosphatase)
MYNATSGNLTMLTEGCVGLGMLDDIPVMNVGSTRITEHSKLFCYTDGLVELAKDDKVEFGTQIIEEAISNPQSIKENIDYLVNFQLFKDGTKDIGIFDDVSIIAFEVFP